MVKLKNFKAQEIVPKHIYIKRGSQSLSCMDKDLLTFIDNFHDYLNKKYPGKISIIINDWLWNENGDHQRGFRTTESKHYSNTSMHSCGKALDFDVYHDGELIPANEIRNIIIDIRHLDFVRPIKFIESGVNWVHVDTRTNDSTNLIIWNLQTKKVTIHKRT